MKSSENWQVVSEKKTFKDVYNFIYAQSSESRADTYPPGDKILIVNIKF